MTDVTTRTGVRVVLADDSVTQSLRMRSVLETLGYAVEVAGDGEAALALVRSHRAEAVVSDLLMPKMDGFELCRAIRSDEDLSGIAVILVTSVFSTDDDRAFALAAGADAVVERDTDPAALGTVIDAAVARIVERSVDEATFRAAHTDRFREALLRKVAESEFANEALASLAGLSEMALASTSTEEVLDAASEVARRVLEGEDVTVLSDAPALPTGVSVRASVEDAHRPEPGEPGVVCIVVENKGRRPAIAVRLADASQFAGDRHSYAASAFFIVAAALERIGSNLEVRRNEQRLRALLTHSPAAIFVKNLDGTYRSVNPAAEHWLGRPARDIIGRRDDELLPADVAAAVSGHDRQVAEGGTALEFEEQLPADEGERTVLTVKYPVFDGGDVDAVAGIAVDVTDRRRAERAREELAKARADQRHAVELNDVVVQGLVVARTALDLGNNTDAREAVSATLESALQLVRQLLDYDITPGVFVRLDATPSPIMRALP